MNVLKTTTSITLTNDVVFDKMMPRNNEVEDASASASSPARSRSTIWSRLEAEKIRQDKIRTKLSQKSNVEHDVVNGTSESSRDREPMKVASTRLQTSKMVRSPVAPKAEYTNTTTRCSSSSTRSLVENAVHVHHPSYSSLPESSLVTTTTKESSSCRLQRLSTMSDSTQGDDEESIFLFCDGSVVSGEDHPEEDDDHHQESNDSTQFTRTASLQEQQQQEQQQDQGETLESLGWADFGGQVELKTPQNGENDPNMEWVDRLLPFSTRADLPPPPPPEDSSSWKPSFDDDQVPVVLGVEKEPPPPAHYLTNEEWIVQRQRREQRCLQTTVRESRNFPSILGELTGYYYPPEDAAAAGATTRTTTTASDHAALLLLRADHDHDQQRHSHRQRRVARVPMTRHARLEFLYHTTWRILGRTSLSILKFPVRLLEKRYPPEPTVDTTFAAAVQPTTALTTTVQWPDSGSGWRFGEPNIEDSDDDATAYWSTGTAMESDSDSWIGTGEHNEQVSLPETFLMDGQHSMTQTFDPFAEDTIAPLFPEEPQFEI